MLRIAVLGAIGIGAAGCQSASSPDLGALVDNPPAAIVHEIYSGFHEPARFVVRDSEQWAEVWSRAFVARSEVPQRPDIDFSKEMVLVAAQGGQGSSGYDIAIDRVDSRDGAIAVDVTTTSPSQDCVVLTVITSPVMMVRTPSSTSQVEYTEHARVTPCVN